MRRFLGRRGLGVAVAALSPVVEPIDYYIDAATGDDGDDGLTEGTAWATLGMIDGGLIVSDTTIRILVKAGTYDTADDYVLVATGATALGPATRLEITFEPGCVMDGTAANAVGTTHGFEFSGTNAWTAVVNGNGLQVNNYLDAAGTSPNSFGNRNGHILYVYNAHVDQAEDGFSAHETSQMYLFGCSAQGCTKAAFANIDSSYMEATNTTFTGASGATLGIGALQNSATALFTNCDFIPASSGQVVDLSGAVAVACKVGTLTDRVDVNANARPALFSECFVNVYADGDEETTFLTHFGKLSLRQRNGGHPTVKGGHITGPASGKSNFLYSDHNPGSGSPFVVEDTIFSGSYTLMALDATNSGYLVAAGSRFHNNCLTNSKVYDADLVSAGADIQNTITDDPLIGAANTYNMADYAFGSGSPCIGAGTGGGDIGFGLSEVVEVGSSVPTITSASTGNCAESATLSHALTANKSVTWSIVGGADQARFEISGSTLRWASNGTKDYEAPDDADTNNTYVVLVQALDSQGNKSFQTITITVTDVAETTFIYPLDEAGAMPEAHYDYIKGAEAYAGDCCQAIRVSDSAPLEVEWVLHDFGDGTGCYRWDQDAMDAHKGAEAYLEIVTWYDHSGNARNETQGTAANRARYYGDHSVKGIKVPRWNNSYYQIPSSVTVNRQAFDCYTVWDLVASNQDSTISHLGDNTTYATFGAIQDATGFGKFQLWGGGSGNPDWRQASGRPSIYYHRGTAANTIVGQAHETYSSTAGSSTTLTGGWHGRLFTGGWEAEAFGGMCTVYGRNLSGGEQTAFRAAVCATHGCTDDPAAIVIVRGDSIDVGSNYAEYVNWARQMVQLLDEECLIFNVSSGGSTMEETDTDYATTLGLLVSRYGASSLTILRQGTNDLTVTGDSAAAIYANADSIAGKVHADSGEVLFATLCPNNAWDAGQRDIWDDYNALIRAGVPGDAEGVVDFQANTNIGDFADAANTALYPDGLHGTQLHASYAAVTASAAINAWLP